MGWIKLLFGNVRFYVLVFSAVLSLAVYVWVKSAVFAGPLQTIRLTQAYALIAVVYLYFTLLAGPLCYVARWLPFRGQYFKARRATGVSVFYFGLLHALSAFFGQLGGFSGIASLNTKYLFAISLGSVSMIILLLMTVTSFDFIVAKMTFVKWKILHRFVYLVSMLILVHALILGTHFRDLSDLIPKIFFVAFAFLMLLEANRFDAWLQKKFVSLQRLRISVILVFVFILVYVFRVLFGIGI